MSLSKEANASDAVEEAGALTEDPTTSNRLLDILSDSGVEFSTMDHEAVRTSEEAAALRGVELASGAKAMLLRDSSKKTLETASPRYYLAVMSASKKLSWKLMKKAVGAKSINLATEEEVWRVTGCRPGAVPPFGSLFGAATFMDTSLESQGETVNFNCGLKTKSVIGLKVADYLKIEKSVVASFCE
jgi:Ala-tRNA(Pro) deacylase